MKVYTWGTEPPNTPSASASFGAEMLLPGEYNRDRIKPSAPCGRRRAPMFAPQGSPYRGAVLSRRSAAVRDLGLGVAADGGNTSQDPTPSVSASYTPERPIEPDKFNADAIEPMPRVVASNGKGRRDGKLAYRGIAPRKHKRGHLTRSSAAIAPASAAVTPGLASMAPQVPLVEQPSKPSLEEISEAAGQLSAVAADSDLRDKLDEIKSQAVSLSMKKRTSPGEFAPGAPLERSWQLLADSVMEAASEIGSADPAALQTTLTTPAERSRVATTEDISSLRTTLERDVPVTPEEEETLLANASTWLTKQPDARGTSRGSINLSALNKIYGTFTSGMGLSDTKSRKKAFKQFNEDFSFLTEGEQVPVAVMLGRAARSGINFLRTSGP